MSIEIKGKSPILLTPTEVLKRLKKIKKMARIVQALTQPGKDYNQQIQQSFVRDVDSIVQKLNSTYQQDLKDESEAEAFFFG